MAEKIEELPALPDAESVKMKTPNVWAPALTVLFLLPVFSFCLSEYVLFPRLKHQMTQVLGNEVKELPAASNTETTAPAGVKQTYEIKDILSNIVGSNQTRYIRVSFVLEGDRADFQTVIKAQEARIIDTTLNILSAISSQDFSNSNIKNVVRLQLLEEFNEIMHEKCITGLYFSQFIIK